MGSVKEPRATSQLRDLPGEFRDSAPMIKADLQRPEAIKPYAEITAAVPELHKLSILCAIFGFIPSISAIMLEEY